VEHTQHDIQQQQEDKGMVGDPGQQAEGHDVAPAAPPRWASSVSQQAACNACITGYWAHSGSL
jgi:hypothetical protein